jgi:hypothetical protein
MMSEKGYFARLVERAMVWNVVRAIVNAVVRALR